MSKMFRKLRFESLESRKLLSAVAANPFAAKAVAKAAAIYGPMPCKAAAISTAVAPSTSIQTLQSQLAVLQSSSVFASATTTIGSSVYGLTPTPIFSSQSIAAANVKVPTLDVLPGYNSDLIQEVDFSVGGHQYDRLSSVIFLAAPGSGLLSQTAHNFTLRAFLNNNWTTIGGVSQVDYASDELAINVWQPVWLRPNQILRVQLLDDFNAWGFSGSQFGTVLAAANFVDLNGNAVPDWNVNYVGIGPVMHKLESATIEVQQEMLYPYESASPGDTNLTFAKVDLYTNNAVVDTISFSAFLGNLANASSLSCQFDTNADGVIDTSVMGVVGPGSTGSSVVTFSLNGLKAWNGEYEIHGDIAAGTAGKVLQLMIGDGNIGTQGHNVTGHDATTGKPLQGVINNGCGRGQVIMTTHPNWDTCYNFVTNPYPPMPLSGQLKVVELGPFANNDYETVGPGQDITIDTGMLVSTADFTVTHMAVVQIRGQEAPSAGNFTLWADLDGVGLPFTEVASGTMVYTPWGNEISFDNFSLPLSQTQPIDYEVHATAPDPVNYNTMQYAFGGANGITAQKKDGTVLDIGQIVIQGGVWQPIIQSGGGLG